MKYKWSRVGGPKCKNENLTKKKGFLSVKHGLNSKVGFKTKFGLKLGEENRGEEGEKKKEEEEAKLRYGTMAMSMGLWIVV